MNATPTGPDQAEREELARLLPPVPAERDMPPGRHLHHKDALMRLVDAEQDRRDARTTAAPAAPFRRRLPRPVVVAGATALALTAALAVGLATGRHGGGTAAPGGARNSSGTAAGAGSHDAVVMLDRLAAVAMKTGVRPVRDDQFVYVRSEVASNQGVFGGPVELGPPHERQVWFSQRQGAVTDVGLIREDGQDWPIEVGVPDGTDPKDAGYPAGIDRPTYAWLASLPTDPGALLTLLYAETSVEKGEDKDQAVFDRIGDLVGEQIMPPATTAAFYKATARIPGVTELSDAVDAAGRHGIAIAREDTAHSTRTEWIFDRTTLAYLGERTRFSKDDRRGKAGAVIDTTAVLERAVVDRRGQEPTGGGS